MNRDNNTPYFTIITPVYNRERCISNAILSIQKQNFTDWEHIIIDDGSIDRTANIIDDASKNDSRIKVIHLPCNQGVSAARNAGISAAKGKYLLFLDSDDEFRIDTCSLLYKILESEKDVDFIIFQGSRITNVPKKREISNEPYQIMLRDEIRQVLLAGVLSVSSHENDHIYRHVLWNKCVKTTIFSDNNILFDTEKRTWEDEEVCIKVIDASDKLAIIDKALVIERTFEVGDHLSMSYYSDGVRNVLSQYKWMIGVFGKEFDFNNTFALNFYFERIQTWLWRTMSKDKNRKAIVTEILKDSDFIQLVKLRVPNGIFEKLVRSFVIKKMYNCAYLVYRLQNFINHGKTF